MDYLQFTVQFKSDAGLLFPSFQFMNLSKPSVPDVIIVNKSSWQTKVSSHMSVSQ